MTDSTKVPVDELSGRELDVAVEVEVFGRAGRFVDMVKINGTWREQATWLPETHIPERPPAGWFAGAMPPSYSTDIELAWEVVVATEMFRDDVRLTSYYPQMDKTTERAVFLHQHDDRDGAYWCVAFYDPGGGCGGSYARGSTAPEAISRAALKAARNA